MGTAGRSVYVLYTGGTFGMAPRADGRLAPMALDQLRTRLPEAPDAIAVTLDGLETPLDSAAMTPNDWIAIASRIADNYDAYDGFVVIHGTDTLAYTASALSFMFEHLAKPVVVTGAQASIAETPTDAAANYLGAVRVAGWRSDAARGLCEVVVVFAGRILRGCRVRKISAESWEAFDSPNCPPLGSTDDGVEIDAAYLRPPPPPDASFRLSADLNTQIADITLYPGIDAERLQASLAGVDGVVLRAYGAGNAPGDDAFLSAIKGPLVVAVTQCLQGGVQMDRYAAAEGIAANGVVSGTDMTPEAALTKLMCVLSKSTGEDAAKAMQSNWRGEISEAMLRH